MDLALRAAVLAAIVGLALALAFWPRLRAACRARELHRRLAAANGLTDRECRWLWQIARRTCPDRPALVFVRPSLLETPPADADPELARAVRGKLFA